MRTARKRWGAAGPILLVVILTAAGVAYWRHRHRPLGAPTAAEVAEDSDVRRWRGFPAGEPAIEGAPPADAGAGSGPGWTDKVITKTQLEGAMTAWRDAILEKNADAVLALDRAFAILPGRYGPQLVRLAETDPDERVRAFSTRVLGKLKNVELAEVFGRLLADRSPFVRQNAAWGLGELADLPSGRAAADVAFDELRRAQEGDPAADVRAAATMALKRLQ